LTGCLTSAFFAAGSFPGAPFGFASSPAAVDAHAVKKHARRRERSAGDGGRRMEAMLLEIEGAFLLRKTPGRGPGLERTPPAGITSRA
jgi:hypothetical protein